LIEFGLLVLEIFLKIFSVFLLFRYYLSYEKGYPFCLNKLESLSPKDDLCQVWLKLAQWFWRSRKCKSLQVDRQTDGSGQKLTWAFSSGELKTTKYDKNLSVKSLQFCVIGTSGPTVCKMVGVNLKSVYINYCHVRKNVLINTCTQL
jgi:hypothetical protein